MVTLVNRAKVSSATTGTGTITLGSAESGYQTFANAGVVDANVVRYVIEDGTDFEIGSGTYTATGTTLSRTLDESSTGALLNLTGAAVVYVSATAADLAPVLELYAENYDGTATKPVATGTNAVAIGRNSTASGDRSIALGPNSTASALFSTAFGYINSATATGATAGGYNSSAGGTYSLAIYGSSASQYSTAIGNNSGGGRATAATGSGAMALGGSYASGTDSFAAAIANNTSSYGATGGHSLAMGWGAKANSSQSASLGGFYSQATNNYAVTLGGSQNTASGSYSVAISGSTNVSSGTYSSALGGQNNTASGSHSVAMGQSSSATQANSIAIGDTATSTTANLIALGGTTDTVQISGTYNLPTVDGTTGQVLTTNGAGVATFADAGGGGTALELYAENPSSPTAPSATGANAVAIGNGATTSGIDAFGIGRDASASGNFSVAIGRLASATTNYTLALGYNSDADGSSSNSIGINTTASSSYSTSLGASSVGSGATTAIGSGAMALGGSYASGADSFAAVIKNNTSSYGATGANSVAIGDLAKATDSDSICLANSSTASGSGSAVLGGRSNTASSSGAVAMGGSSNTANGTRSFAYGYYGNTDGITNKVAHGIGPSRQNGMYGLAIDTTDATPASLATDYFSAGALTQVILPNNSAFAFHGTIVARQSAATGTACAAWKVEGLIRREGSAGTTVLVNSATTILDNTPAWGMTLSADTTNGGLAITVTGAAATNIRFVATINTSEVTY